MTEIPMSKTVAATALFGIWSIRAFVLASDFDIRISNFASAGECAVHSMILWLGALTAYPVPVEWR
jgi:hypothetical protein